MRQRARKLVVAALILTLVAPMALHAGDLEGTYRLVKRVLPDGTEQGWGADGVMGLMTMGDGWRNFNLTWTQDGQRSSLSIIAEYTLDKGEYCETVHYWHQNNLRSEGVSYEAPGAKSQCAAVSMEDGRISFDHPREPVVMSFGEDGFTAVAEGRAVDHWKRMH